MTSKKEATAIATDFAVSKVDRIHGEQTIAICFEHVSGREVALALSEQEAAVLLVRLLAALQTEDKTPQTSPTTPLQRHSDTSVLRVAEITVRIDPDMALLLIETADGLQIPFTLSHYALAGLGEALARLREHKGN